MLNKPSKSNNKRTRRQQLAQQKLIQEHLDVAQPNLGIGESTSKVNSEEVEGIDDFIKLLHKDPEDQDGVQAPNKRLQKQMKHAKKKELQREANGLCAKDEVKVYKEILEKSSKLCAKIHTPHANFYDIKEEILMDTKGLSEAVKKQTALESDKSSKLATMKTHTSKAFAKVEVQVPTHGYKHEQIE